MWAIGSSSALATNQLQVVNEKNNTVCGTIVSPHTTGGCRVHVAGLMTLQAWAFTWFTEATCMLELEMRVSGTGVGTVDDMDLYDGDANCDGVGGEIPAMACDLPWEGRAERIDATNFHAVADVCLDVAEVDICGSTIEYDVVEDESTASEDYGMEFVNTSLGAVCRVSGTLTMESSQATNAALHLN